MAPRLLTLLLALPLATAYLTGEDVTLCWVSRNGTRELLSTCGADFVEFVTTLPTTVSGVQTIALDFRGEIVTSELTTCRERTSDSTFLRSGRTMAERVG